MNAHQAQISKNGRIVVPAAYRTAMGLKGGEVLNLSLDENGLHVRTLRQELDDARAALREYIGPGRSLSDELIAERRLEVKREIEGG